MPAEGQRAWSTPLPALSRPFHSVDKHPHIRLLIQLPPPHRHKPRCPVPPSPLLAPPPFPKPAPVLHNEHAQPRQPQGRLARRPPALQQAGRASMFMSCLLALGCWALHPSSRSPPHSPPLPPLALAGRAGPARPTAMPGLHGGLCRVRQAARDAGRLEVPRAQQRKYVVCVRHHAPPSTNSPIHPPPHPLVNNCLHQHTSEAKFEEWKNKRGQSLGDN